MRADEILNDEMLIEFITNLEFKKNGFSTYDYSNESTFYFYYNLFSYLPLKNKKLSKRLSLVLEDTSLEIILDGSMVGSLNYYQHSCFVEDHPTHWFDVQKKTDINYVLLLLVKYSLKNGLTIEELKRSLERKVLSKYRRY